jgi:hypothetical protein
VRGGWMVVSAVIVVWTGTPRLTLHFFWRGGAILDLLRMRNTCFCGQNCSWKLYWSATEHTMSSSTHGRSTTSRKTTRPSTNNAHYLVYRTRLYCVEIACLRQSFFMADQMKWFMIQSNGPPQRRGANLVFFTKWHSR